MRIALSIRMNADDFDFRPAAVALLLTLYSALTHAAPDTISEAITSLDALRAAANQALQERTQALGHPVTITFSDLDPRLRLARCSRPLESSIAGDGELHDYTSVMVRCAGEVRWTVYLRAAITSEVSVLTARATLPRGAEPSDAVFESTHRTVPGSGAEYPADAAQLRGLRLKQPMAAGEVLTRSRLEPAAVIRRGQRITLVARDAGIEIRVSAVALADGRPAERIQVQNESSRQIVEAVVRDAAVAEIPL